MKFTPESFFWHWFQRNQATYLQLQEQQQDEFDYWQAELIQHLNACCSGASASLGYDIASGQGSLVFRQVPQDYSDGKLEALAKAAPVLPGWQVIFTSEMAKYPDARTLVCNFVEEVDERGRPALLVYVPIKRTIPEGLKATIEALVIKILSDAGCLPELALIAVEDFSEIPMQENLPTLAQLPTWLQRNRQAS